MAKASDVYTEESESEYLNEEEKKQIAKAGREFSILEIDQAEGEYGPCWDLKLGFTDTGEIKRMFMGMSERRDPKMTAWQTYLIANEGENIGPVVYQRGKTKAGQTWSDIVDA